MALTTARKEYIARELGVNNCFVYSGLSWTVVSVLGDTETETGGTGKIVSRIISGAVDHVDLAAPRTKTFRATDLSGVTLADVMNTILKEDNMPTTETQYCVGAPPVTPPVTPIHKIVKIVPPAGEELVAYVSDIEIPMEMTIGESYSGAVVLSVTSTSEYKAEIVFRRYPTGWDGAIASLPGAAATITTETKTLNSGSQRLNWTWTVPNIPGDFVIISRLYAM